MVKVFFTFIFLSLKAYALDGIVTVLEAPVFAVPDEKSKVVQYYRKGDVVYIHPQEAFKDEFEEKIEALSTGVEADLPPDPLFDGKQVYYPKEGSEFYKTISRNGKQAFMLKEHLILKTKDPREFNQKIIDHDHTDYRLDEPLIDGYPFIQESGYKGLSQFAVGRPNFQAYPFSENISDTEIDFSAEFNFIWSKARKVDPDLRFFFGLMLSLGTASVDYLLNTQRATQQFTRFSIGPFASYDVLRNKKYGLNVYFSLQTSLLDEMEVTVTNSTTNVSESRSYTSLLPMTSVVGVNYQFYRNLYMLDTVIGTNVRFNFPKTYQVGTSARQSDFWESTANDDQFFHPLTTELNFFVGLQSYY